MLLNTGHAFCDLSQCRRETLNSETSLKQRLSDTLCLTCPCNFFFFFGDDLQAQLTSIRTTNRVSNAIREETAPHRNPNIQLHKNGSNGITVAIAILCPATPNEGNHPQRKIKPSGNHKGKASNCY